GVDHAGTARSAEEAEQVTLLEAAPGVLVAHLSYTYGFNGTDVPADKPWLANKIDTERILEDATGARTAGADFVVVSLHWGLEYQYELTEQQREVAPAVLASPDVDLVIGHHAHVIQPVERIGDEFVAYGLGNFISNQSPETCGCPIGVEDGVLLEFEVVADDEGRFTVETVRAHPTWVDRTGGHVVIPTDAGGVDHDADPDTLTASSRRTRTALGAQVE
ncbi:MAG: CapA family protein, partial [Acidimicrobiales bacterium]|nr:CapA family protein [Acidimicrobiales bacterium]